MAFRVPQLMEVVEHQDEGRRALTEGRRDDRRRPAERRAAVSTDAVGNARRFRGDPTEGSRQQDQQADRIIVEPVDRHPGDRPVLFTSPLREQRGFPVAGGRRHRDDPTATRPCSSMRAAG